MIAKAWLRAMEMTAPIDRNPQRVLATVVEEFAALTPDKPALLSDAQTLTYGELADRVNRYSRWALGESLEKDQVVCLLMPNQPEYVAVWLGISRVGGVVSLLNTNLSGPQLAHCIDIVQPKHLIVAESLIDRLLSALPDLKTAPILWTYGGDRQAFRRIDRALERVGGSVLLPSERRSVTIDDRALCIYTSGTTGLTKAANVSHARVMHWSHWFCGMMGAQAEDRMFTCLPMYHSVGGVAAPGALLAAGGSVAIDEKFSASRFWHNVTKWRCTLFQYIGELGRYLLETPESPHDAAHGIRMACGNGMAMDVWEKFQERFHIPRILEFYAATEGGVSLFNVEGEPGSIGRVPPYLEHRYSPVLVKLDVETGEPVRNEQGFCVRCVPGEIGEAIAPWDRRKTHAGSRFEGYTDQAASDRKLLRNVLEAGDLWVRTGDLLRRDARGFFYFVDRAGDTFRYKGENVATTEVAQVISTFPGVRHANVYGVSVPFTEGRAGMAALVTDEAFDLGAFRQHLANRLPRYARPVFLRFTNQMDITATFKYSKTEFVRSGFDPSATTDAIYFDDPEAQSFVRIDSELYRRISRGAIRL